LTDQTLEELALNCLNIKHLNLTRIPKLGDKSMVAVAQFNDLEFLALYATAEITSEGFNHLFTLGLKS
jgi:hypothetical protein